MISDLYIKCNDLINDANILYHIIENNSLSIILNKYFLKYNLK